MIIDGELHTITRSLASLHLGYAVDNYRRSRMIGAIRDGSSYHKMQSNACAISSMLHAFCALESFVNYLAYELFSNKESKIFIPPDQRNLLLAKFARSWDVTSVLDKYLYLVCVHKSGAVPERLQNQLRELNSLRNWIAHGVSYTTTFLLQPKADADRDEYLVIDLEHSIDWRARFPNTKFKMLEESDQDDAETALRIVLGALQLLGDCMEQPLWFVTYEGERSYQILFRRDCDIEKIFATDPERLESADFPLEVEG